MAIKQSSVTKVFSDITAMEFRGKVFSGRGIETVDVHCLENGSVLAWDDVAGHMTRCHSISERNLRAIRKTASKRWPVS